MLEIVKHWLVLTKLHSQINCKNSQVSFCLKIKINRLQYNYLMIKHFETIDTIKIYWRTVHTIFIDPTPSNCQSSAILAQSIRVDGWFPQQLTAKCRGAKLKSVWGTVLTYSQQVECSMRNSRWSKMATSNASKQGRRTFNRCLLFAAAGNGSKSVLILSFRAFCRRLGRLWTLFTG